MTSHFIEHAKSKQNKILESRKMEKDTGRIVPIYQQIPPRKNLLERSRRKKVPIIHESPPSELPLFIRKKYPHQQHVCNSGEKVNTFSKHDNRHSLQDKGEYFGQGLGKKYFKEINHHHRKTQFKISTPESQQNCLEEQKDKHSDSKTPQVITHHRRFPRQYNKPSPNSTIPTDTTSWWPPADNYRTPTQVLTITQTIPGQANSWRYSYKSTIFPSIATRDGCHGHHHRTNPILASTC